MQVFCLLVLLGLKLYLFAKCNCVPIELEESLSSLENGKAGIIPFPDVPGLTTTTTTSKPGLFQIPTKLPLIGDNGLGNGENGAKLIIGGFQAIIMPFNPSALSQLTNLPNILGGMG